VKSKRCQGLFIPGRRLPAGDKPKTTPLPLYSVVKRIHQIHGTYLYFETESLWIAVVSRQSIKPFLCDLCVSVANKHKFEAFHRIYLST
jgi:hypothetical protein